MASIFQHTFTVPDSAIDALGHVNNVVYVQWMQDVAIMHSDSLGGTIEKYMKLGAIWVVKTHRIEYHGPAFAGDRIIAKTWVSNIKNTSSLRKYKFFRESDNKIIAAAETMWVFINLKNGRPVTIPDEISDMFTFVTESEEP